MFCGNCGHEITKEGNFCPSCGAELRTEDSRPKKKEKRSGRSPAVLAVCLVLLTVVIGVAGFFAYTGIRNWQYARCVEEGAALVAEQSWSEAAEAYEKASQIKPKEELPYLRLAEIFEAQDNLEQIVRILEEGCEKTESEQIRAELVYYNAAASVKIALADGDYETAIDCLETMIESKPDIADNYLALAEAYVQVWDLYRADETLRKGYAVTKDAALRHVSIWGPLPPEQIAFFASFATFGEEPYIRCEYIFADSGIYGYLLRGSFISMGVKYICEDERVKYVSIFDALNSNLRDVLPRDIPYYPDCSALIYYDYLYDESGRIYGALLEGETLFSLTYNKGKCVKLTLDMEDHHLFNKGDEVTFTYDEQNRITGIRYLGDDGRVRSTRCYTYNPDGSCSVGDLESTAWVEFDENGMMVSARGCIMKEPFTMTKIDKGVLRYQTQYYYFNRKYVDGKLTETSLTNSSQTLIAKYRHQNIGGVEYLTERQRIDEFGAIEGKDTYSYDEQGNLIRICYYDGNDYVYSYSDDGLLVEEIHYDNGEIRARYKMEYDEVGRLINKTEVG